MKNITPTMKPSGLSMETDKQEFALSLKTWRLRNAYTQKQVAHMFGVSRYTIMRAEAAQDITWMMAYRLFAKLSHYLQEEQKDEIYNNH